MLEPQLTIIWQDEFFIAIEKPSGLLVHRSIIDKHETRFALQMLRDQLQQTVYPIHRLDKPTSGILLFAFSQEAATQMSRLFEVGNIQKQYLAIVRGIAPERLDIDHPVKAIKNHKHEKTKPPKDGQTQLERLATTEIAIAVDKYPTSRYSLVKLTPKTGRRHQLRYHMKHISHPIIGDAKYGKSNHNRFFAEHFQCSRLLLAATQLSFIHPQTDQAITLSCLPNGSFLHTCKQLGWSNALEGACNAS